MKYCNRCGEYKDEENFYRSVREKSGLSFWCKECNKKYQNEHKEHLKDLQLKWRQNNIERCKKYDRNRDHRRRNQQQALNIKMWKKAHPERIKEIRKKANKKGRSTLKGRLFSHIGGKIWKALRNKKGGLGWEKLLGYSIEDLMTHLERLWKPGMNWGNYGKNGWHIDHKIPKSFFEFKNPNDVEFQYCWSLENLQPLWAVENMKKWKKIN